MRTSLVVGVLVLGLAWVVWEEGPSYLQARRTNRELSERLAAMEARLNQPTAAPSRRPQVQGVATAKARAVHTGLVQHKIDDPCTPYFAELIPPYGCFSFAVRVVVFVGSAMTTVFYPFNSLIAIVLLRAQPLVLPSELALLPELKWMLVEETVEGALPEELGDSPALQQLYFFRTKVGAALPTTLGNLVALSSLELKACQLPGPIPSELARVTTLRIMDLESSLIEGSLPSELALMTQMTYIDLSSNSLRGTVSPAFGSFDDLLQLNLADNLLESSVPSELAHLSLLTTLDLRENFLEGTVPISLGESTSLKLLDLGSNKLTGTVPPQLANITTLQHLYLNDNELEGTIPLGLLSRDLRSLWLSGNRLTGTVAVQLGQVGNLTMLGLGRNLFSGTLPSQLGRLVLLEVLDLSSNRLTGTLPPQLWELRALTELTLNDNGFTGTVSALVSQLALLEVVDISQNSLEGSLPPALTNSSLDLAVSCVDSGLDDDQCQREIKGPFLEPSTYLAVVAVVAVVAVAVVVLSVAVRYGPYHPDLDADDADRQRAPSLQSFKHNSKFLTPGSLKLEEQDVGLPHPFLYTSVAGLLLILACVVVGGLTMLDTRDTVRDVGCVAASQTLSYGVVLVLSAVGLRNYPIWHQLNAKAVLSPKVHYKRLAVAVVLDMCVIVPLSVLASPNALSYGCKFKYPNLITGAVGVVVVLAAFVGLVTFKARSVPDQTVDTSRINLALTSFLTYGFAMILVNQTTSEPTSNFLVLALSMLLMVLTFALLVLVPRAKGVVGHVRRWASQRKAKTHEGVNEDAAL